MRISLNKAIIIPILITLGFAVSGQNTSKELMSQHTSFFSFVWSNDFINQTDRYFSNGFDLMLVHPFMDRSPSRFLLIKTNKSDEVHHGVTLVHHFFTPDNLFETEILKSDRPYASYLLLGHRQTEFFHQRKIKFQSELQLGILGRYSGGRTLQNNLHELFPGSSPSLGWQNQLNTDLALNYSLKIEKGVLSTSYMEIIPTAATRLGIPYTDISAGFLLRTGRLNEYFTSFGLPSKHRPHFYFFSEIEGRLVFYNATLQGGVLSDHPHTLSQIHPWLLKADVGAVVGFRKWRLEYHFNILSPEYKGGMTHRWGALHFFWAI